MWHEAWARTLRPTLLPAAIGVALGGCVCCGPRFYGDDGRRPGYGRTPDSDYGLIRSQAGRGNQGWTPPQPSADSRPQDPLRGYGIRQSR